MKKNIALITFVVLAWLWLSTCSQPSSPGSGQEPAAPKDTTAVVLIEAGTFTMGENEDKQEVTIATSFYMSAYPVTQKRYSDVMGKTIAAQQALAENPSEENWGRGNDHPMYYVSWYDAIAFCNTLSISEGLSPVYSLLDETSPVEWGIPGPSWDDVEMDSSANGYRLPTEAEWEYACRAGTNTAYPGETSVSDSTGWYKANSGNSAHETGEKSANAWGLYDMSGNVWEWCWDIYEDTSFRIVRGGSWESFGSDLPSAGRSIGEPSQAFYDTGFRLVRGE